MLTYIVDAFCNFYILHEAWILIAAALIYGYGAYCCFEICQDDAAYGISRYQYKMSSTQPTNEEL